MCFGPWDPSSVGGMEATLLRAAFGQICVQDQAAREEVEGSQDCWGITCKCAYVVSSHLTS
eukprot:scaffold119944_cov17-Tisochrysis_lutea.AAC.2